MNSLRNIYYDAIEFLAKDNLHLSTALTKLGYPQECSSTKTACIGWDRERKKSTFKINPEFIKILNREERVHTVAHEALHLLHGHIFYLRDELERMEKLQKTHEEVKRMKKRFNIAADCVVNDSLVNIYGLPKVMASAGKARIIYGMDEIGIHCHDLSVLNVMHILPDGIENKYGDDDDHDGWGEFIDANGFMDSDFVRQIKDFIDGGRQNSSLNADELKKLNDLDDALNKSRDANIRKVNAEKKANFRSFSLGSANLKWNFLLKDFVETKKYHDRWSRINKKYASFYPKTILPDIEPQQREKIDVFIDSSGSIDKRALSLFINILRGMPEHIQVHSIAFDEQCYKYNIFGKEAPRGGAGTRFDIIENYIQKNLDEYPKVVFVLTDGEGNTVSPQYPERWIWLLYGKCDVRFCQNMRYYKVADLLL